VYIFSAFGIEIKETIFFAVSFEICPLVSHIMASSLSVCPGACDDHIPLQVWRNTAKVIIKKVFVVMFAA
jgi:hypothetical protein